jgi:pyruvate formate lyase activating enzyme
LATKVDTNGSHANRLKEPIKGGLLDYVALDLKAPLGSYERIAGAGVDPGRVGESRRFVVNSGFEHEIRTTYSERFLSLDDLREIAGMVRGCRRFSLQAFRAPKTLDPALLKDASPLPEQMEEARLIFQSAGIPVTLH